MTDALESAMQEALKDFSGISLKAIWRMIHTDSYIVYVMIGDKQGEIAFSAVELLMQKTPDNIIGLCASRLKRLTEKA